MAAILASFRKPVTFEQFEITKPNSVSRLGTNPEFSQILKFSVFWKSKMADGSHLGIYSGSLYTFEPFEITKPNKVSRLGTNPEFSQILKFSVFQK